jgi:precorrin-6A/cobalt-precorrin-6A reductase
MGAEGGATQGGARARGRGRPGEAERVTEQRPVLILGGTSDARELASRLDARPGLRIVSSLAGRTKSPVLPPGETRIGGFGGVPGLARWLRDHCAAAVVDATHPFAAQISANAEAACREAGAPLLRFQRRS